MKFKKSKGNHWTIVIFLTALAIIFISLISMFSSAEQISQVAQTTIGIIKGVIGR